MECLGRSLGQNPAEEPQTLSVFGRETSQGTPFTMIPPRHFPYNVIPSVSWTRKEGFISANGLPREYHGQCVSFAGQILVELNPNILVRDVERMYNVYRI